MTNTTSTTNRKRFTGTVVAAGKMAKTITVAVDRFPWHPRVRKQVRRTKHYLVHDAAGQAREGDRVTIEETRPLSKRKHFRLIEVQSPKSKVQSSTSKVRNSASEVESGVSSNARQR